MKEYNDAALNELIIVAREVTQQLTFLKYKKVTPQIKELLSLRRNRLQLIRERARELNLTETDLETIRVFVHMRE